MYTVEINHPVEYPMPEILSEYERDTVCFIWLETISDTVTRVCGDIRREVIAFVDSLELP